jgi:hypothetical protein
MKETLQWRSLTDTTFQTKKVNMNINKNHDSIYPWFGMIKVALNLRELLFSHQSTDEKNITQIPWRDIVQNSDHYPTKL